jgi:hypothetical protein
MDRPKNNKAAWDKTSTIKTRRGSSDDEWGDIDLVLMPGREIDLPTPILYDSMLPTEMLAGCREIGRQKGAPVDYAVAGLLSCAAGVIGSARKVVTRNAGWKEPCILWIMID